MGKQVVLEGYIEASKDRVQFLPEAFPYLIGRDPACPLNLNTHRVSRLHACLEELDGDIYIRDLRSTNGTFVNHRRIHHPHRLEHGDVIHVGEHEFRVQVALRNDDDDAQHQPTILSAHELSHRFSLQSREFLELLSHGMVQGYAQRITDREGNRHGYELLGRSAHPELTEGPVGLFTLASELDEETALSELMRRQCLQEAQDVALQGFLFFNTHPEECRNTPRLIKELHRLREAHPDLNLVCEIHEGAVTSETTMRELRATLRDLDMKLAYDDFGAGQARLMELVEVPPDYLKFDIALVRGLASEDSSTEHLMRTLDAMMHDMGIQTLAEGIESRFVADLCTDIGINYFQGFYYGKPRPITVDLRATTAALDVHLPERLR